MNFLSFLFFILVWFLLITVLRMSENLVLNWIVSSCAGLCSFVSLLLYIQRNWRQS